MDNIPDTMRAFVLQGHGDFDQLEFHDKWPTPVPGPMDVLVKVHACGLNNTDINTRTAWYSKGVTEETTGDAFVGADDTDASWGGAAIVFPRIQGADVVGTVVQVGGGLPTADAERLIGKRILVEGWLRNWDKPDALEETGYYGSECDGGYADYTLVDYRHAYPVNSALSDTELATFSTAYITAENMLNRASVEARDTVLITGASGGVGSALIQLAKRRGATTVALTSASKADGLQELGADYVLDRSSHRLATDLQALTGKSTVSVVADVVGGAQWSSTIEMLQRGGRYTCAGAIGGPIVEFDLRTFYLRDLTFTGATVVPTGVFADLVTYIERGEINPVLAATYPLDRLIDAQKAFIEKKYTGKIVIDHSL